jgi:acyl-CoA oxidase
MIKAITELPALRPFWPMLYVAWADGVLTHTELSTLRNTARAYLWLEDHERAALLSWLDPAAPPNARQLQQLLAQIRGAAGSTAERVSLVDLGLAIARDELEADRTAFRTSETMAALEDIEEALGVCSVEAARAVVGPPALHLVEVEPVPGRATTGLQELLDGPRAQVRARVRDVLLDPSFTHRYGLDLHTHRELVLARLQILADADVGKLAFGEFFGARHDLGAFIAAFETVALFDLSLTVKMGVQFGLFGGSIYFLGTKAQRRRYLPDVVSLGLPGCFAMTERGHGSNVANLRTTATWCPDSDTLEVHTPVDSACKEYIGNAAAHGRMATVYAQLRVGEEEHGVHAILVPLRDDSGECLPGVRIEDCGHKMGLNGVDNGRIWFDKVHVPRANLLGRYGHIQADGTYTSPIASPSRRFFTMLGTLVGGRISVALAASSATKVALTNAVRYATTRRQFGPGDGRPETRLLDYRYHQKRLMPALARTYAVHFALRDCVRAYEDSLDMDDKRDIEARAAALKVISTWHATATIQTCRQACGGAGYLSENRFGELKADTDVFTTFEGDNVVLLQLVARNLLAQFKRQFTDDRMFSLLKYVARQATSAILERNPIVTHDTSEEHLRSAAFQLSAFVHRETDLLGSVAQRLRRRIVDEKMDAFDAFNDCQPHVIDLARAYAERLVMESMATAVVSAPEHLRPALSGVRDLFALSAIQADIGWFLENDWVEPRKTKAIRKLVHDLCSEVAGDAPALVDAFGIPEQWLAPIARAC